MWGLRAILLLLPVMAQCNFVDNVMHSDPTPIYDEVILNSEIMADMAASPRYGARYPSPSEISIGAGYTIKFEENEKVLYKSSVKCEQNTLAELVISHINEERGTSTSRIGTTFSEELRSTHEPRPVLPILQASRIPRQRRRRSRCPKHGGHSSSGQTIRLPLHQQE